MKDITKKEYLEAVSKGIIEFFKEEMSTFHPECFLDVLIDGVREGASDAFTDGIGSTYNLFSAISEGVSLGFANTSKEKVKEGLLNGIKDELMKGEKPCKR